MSSACGVSAVSGDGRGRVRYRRLAFVDISSLHVGCGWILCVCVDGVCILMAVRVYEITGESQYQRITVSGSQNIRESQYQDITVSVPDN